MQRDVDYRFERLEHTVYGGERCPVPIYIHSIEGLTEDSKAVLHAVDIIGGNLHMFEGGLTEVAAKIGAVISQPEYDETKGFIIPDEFSSSSVQINGLNTRVSVDSLGVWDVDTALIADMVQQWVTYDSGSAEK
jgi:hypothetical protein